jgi:bacterioferritin (cytochrome b1)
VLATEIVCWMRYTRHAISATGIDRAQVAAEFTEHADQERAHAMRAAERISQLGGDPDFHPATLAARSHTTYETSTRGRGQVAAAEQLRSADQQPPDSTYVPEIMTLRPARSAPRMPCPADPVIG